MHSLLPTILVLIARAYRNVCGCCAEFPAATVDYDADSDSVEEFSSGDEAPMDFLDFDESEFPEDPQGEAALEAAAEEEGEETEEEGDEDEEDEDDPPVASSSGQGPIIEVAGMPSW